jgi:hypothetical protein
MQVISTGITILIFSLFVFNSCTFHQDEQRGATDYDIRDDLDPDRLTIAMWDFSWLYMHYPGGAFEDWEKVLDELKVRKFNTIRIDAFPMIIGKLSSEDQTITIAGDPLRNWGASDRNRIHHIVQELITFMRLTRDRGFHVILSTWNQDCVEFPDLKTEYATDAKQYWRAWEHVLHMLDGHGLLEHVVYVDLDQEFPYFSPFAEEIHRSEGGDEPLDQGMEDAGQGNGLAWNQRQLHFVQSYLQTSLAHFQHRFPRLRFTFSFTSYWEEIRSLGIRHFDVLELHIWMTQMDRFMSRTGFGKIEKDRGQHDYSDYMDRIDATMHAVSPMLKKEMHNQLRFARDWAEEIAVPLTTTEAWGPWWHMDHPDLHWQWLYDWCRESMALSAEYGFWGSTPWNYSHPYWENWKRVEWYQQVNEHFLNN